MTEVTSARRQRSPKRILLLSLLVFGHFLCSICHATAALAGAPADVDVVPVSVQTADETANNVALHGLNEDGQSVFCVTAGDVGVDQRPTEETALMLLVLGVVLTIVLWAAPPRPGSWLIRRPPITATRGGPSLLLSLCIQRV